MTYTPTAVGTGSHTITASYCGDSTQTTGGDSTHAASSGTTTVTVTTRATSTIVSCLPTSGRPCAHTALPISDSITGRRAGAGDHPTPGGGGAEMSRVLR